MGTTDSEPRPAVRPGYKIARDDRNLTENERQILGQLAMGKNIADAARAIGVSRQRGYQLVKALEKKQVVRRDKGLLEIIVAKGEQA